jgi:hypothetical protein
MSRYEPLSRYLEGRREGEVPLTFKEVEGILNHSLPPSARQHQPWWANTTTHSHADAWLRVGWKTRHVDLANQRVIFFRERKGEPSMFSPAQEKGGITVELRDLHPAAAKLLADYGADANGNFGVAVARALLEAAMARRGRLIDRMRANAPVVGDDSVDLIREDRDAR